MTTDEKIDLIISEITGVKSEMSDMRTDITGLKSEMSDMRTEISGIKTDITGMKSEMSDMRTDITGLKSEMSDMKSKIDTLEKRQESVEAQLARNNILIENNLLRKLDIMIEAQQVYEERFPSVRKLQTDVELLKVDVSALKMAFNKKIS